MILIINITKTSKIIIMAEKPRSNFLIIAPHLIVDIVSLHFQEAMIRYPN